jgi:hypothetical protein
MATSYVRLRALWGALDLTAAQGQTPAYTASQIVSLGASAAAGSGVGVRRVSLYIDRATADVGADPAFMHFDVLNTTSGSPDDTWIAADYNAVESALGSLAGAMATWMPTGYKVTEFIWHRVGTGVSKPNPAERTTIVTTPVTGTGGARSLPQTSCSLTFRTGVRRSWGRTYMPLGDQPISFQRVPAATVDAIATAVNAFVTSLASSDMHLVVVSKPLASSLNVEHIEVDDVADVIRRRRWKQTKYRKILP